MLRTQASDEEVNDVFSRCLFIVASVVTSEALAGQQVDVFSMYAPDTGHDEVLPKAAPRGRSVSFPTQGNMVTFVT